MSADESLTRAEELLKRVEAARASSRSSRGGGRIAGAAVELLGELSELAKAVEAELSARSGRRPMHSPDELKALVEEALERLDLWPELHGQATRCATRSRWAASASVR